MSKYLDFAEIYCKKTRSLMFEVQGMTTNLLITFRWTGKCDPKNPEMVKWFEKRRQLKRLHAWGEMTAF